MDPVITNYVNSWDTTDFQLFLRFSYIKKSAKLREILDLEQDPATPSAGLIFCYIFQLSIKPLFSFYNDRAITIVRVVQVINNEKPRDSSYEIVPFSS